MSPEEPTGHAVKDDAVPYPDVPCDSDARVAARPSVFADVMPDEAVVLARVCRALKAESDHVPDLAKEEADLQAKIDGLQALCHETRSQIDAHRRERDEAIKDLRTYYEGLYEAKGSVSDATDEDPDVHDAVRDLADDAPATRDMSHDAESDDVPTLDTIGDLPKTYYGGVAGGGMVIGSAMDVTDDDLAAARVQDQREAAANKTEPEPAG